MQEPLREPLRRLQALCWALKAGLDPARSRRCWRANKPTRCLELLSVPLHYAVRRIPNSTIGRAPAEFDGTPRLCHHCNPRSRELLSAAEAFLVSEVLRVNSFSARGARQLRADAEGLLSVFRPFVARPERHAKARDAGGASCPPGCRRGRSERSLPL